MSENLSLDEFDEKFALGIDEIDDQHHTIFEMLDKLTATVPDLYKPLDDDEVDDVLDVMTELREYALIHFNTEESYMEAVNYPGLSEQDIAHRRFIRDMTRMEAELMNGTSMPLIKVKSFIYEWYVDHLNQMDLPFGKFHKENAE